MVLVQKWPFFRLFFLGNIGQENVFYDILENKKAFLGCNKKTFKKFKWYCWKNGHFSNFFFLGNIGKENFFYDIQERNIAFLG